MPRKKEGRAARLAALERDANGGSTTSVTPETGEPITAPDSVAGEAQNGQPKLDGQEESRADADESEPDGKVKREQAINDESDLIDLEDEKKNGVDQGAPKCNGKEGQKSRAGDKEPKLIELPDSDSPADEKGPINGRTAEAIPA